jgi:uncharacterized membrane protein YidH (DUF202 family)
VGLLTLLLGTLIPWLGGTLWLIFADSRFSGKTPVNVFRQIGYGFFLGYAVLFLAIVISEKLGGGASWLYLMVFLVIFATAGALAAWWCRDSIIYLQRSKPAFPTSNSKRLFLAVILLLTLVHLVFVVVEITTQAIYPWDAWLVWVYRAKAWFLSGSMVDFVAATEWSTATSADVFTIEAWPYPLFPSVVPYWAALSLGQWSETLVNLPVLCAGLAIGMALYGQCREHGLSVFISLIVCYLLYSIPLLGTHLALAGYADVWMAGFTGLGFIAVMRSAMTLSEANWHPMQMIVGSLMIIFGIWVKNEGAVWFLAALAMLLLATCRPRVPILMIVSAVVIILLGFTLGHTYVDIPWIGGLGVVKDKLSIPFIGSFTLETHNVWHVYWENFINMGSWNLLWVAVAGSLLLGFRSPNLLSGYRVRRTALSFILIFLSTQVFIFGFTDKGLWADTYTAINRLPIHFVPTLLFAIVTIVHASLENEDG